MRRDRRFLSLVLAGALTVSCLSCCRAAEQAKFPDVQPDDWFAPYVEVCAEEGLIKGTGDGLFAPDAPVSVGEAVVMAARVLQMAQHETGGLPKGGSLEEFVTEFLYERHLYRSEAAYAAAAAPVREGAARWENTYAWDALWALYYDGQHAGLEELYALDPGAPVTRYQFFDTLGYASLGIQGPRLDYIRSSWYPDQEWSDRIRGLYECGVLEGTDGDKTFSPEEPLTRAQAAAALARLVRQDLRVGPAAHEPQEVAAIYRSYSSFGFTDTEVKLDLEDHLCWTFYADDWENRVERDPAAENEGFQTSTPLTEEAVAAFRESDGLAALLDWQAEYIDPAILDGLQWTVRICFTDGTSRGICGSNAYPETWSLLEADIGRLLSTDTP